MSSLNCGSLKRHQQSKIHTRLSMQCLIMCGMKRAVRSGWERLNKKVTNFSKFRKFLIQKNIGSRQVMLALWQLLCLVYWKLVNFTLIAFNKVSISLQLSTQLHFKKPAFLKLLLVLKPLIPPHYSLLNSWSPKKRTPNSDKDGNGSDTVLATFCRICSQTCI